MTRLKKIIICIGLIGLTMLPLLLSACNTIEGLGKDATAAGDAITGAAQKTKGY